MKDKSSYTFPFGLAEATVSASRIDRPTMSFRWFIPDGMPADYPPVLQQGWIVQTHDGEATEEWKELPLVRGK